METDPLLHFSHQQFFGHLLHLSLNNNPLTFLHNPQSKDLVSEFFQLARHHHNWLDLILIWSLVDLDYCYHLLWKYLENVMNCYAQPPDKPNLRLR